MKLKRLSSIFKPNQFQGWGRKKTYFEGWYYKLVSEAEDHALAIIPGIAIESPENHHAFIQVLNGKDKTAEYHKFELDAFWASSKEFSVSIGNNKFNDHLIQLDLPNLSGKLQLKGNVLWPNKWYSPGIMGPFSFVPFMECYHGIVSMNNILQGSFQMSGKELSFTGGRGYIEKDWGKSFPSAYIWMQSNHFNSLGASFKLSVAKIPWLGSSFVGFISGIWINNQIIRFTTYNRSRLEKCEVTNTEVNICLSNPRYKLEVSASRTESTELASPINGLMDGKISESMTSEIYVKLTNKKHGKVEFEAKGRNAGVEVAGNISELVI